MLVEYDPEAGGVIEVAFHPRHGRTFGEQLDERRIMHRDEAGQVISVEFLFVDQGVDLTGIPQAEEIAETLRSLGRVRITTPA